MAKTRQLTDLNPKWLNNEGEGDSRCAVERDTQTVDTVGVVLTCPCCLEEDPMNFVNSHRITLWTTPPESGGFSSLNLAGIDTTRFPECSFVGSIQAGVVSWDE